MVIGQPQSVGCSTTLLTNKDGSDIGQFLYTPFGEMWVEEASTVDISHITRFFTNQQYDKESGLYYYNARYYDPHLGSFITPDPSMSGLNHYNYANSNPIKYTDPSGLASVSMDAGMQKQREAKIAKMEWIKRHTANFDVAGTGESAFDGFHYTLPGSTRPSLGSAPAWWTSLASNISNARASRQAARSARQAKKSQNGEENGFSFGFSNLVEANLRAKSIYGIGVNPQNNKGVVVNQASVDASLQKIPGFENIATGKDSISCALTTLVKAVFIESKLTENQANLDKIVGGMAKHLNGSAELTKQVEKYLNAGWKALGLGGVWAGAWIKPGHKQIKNGNYTNLYSFHRVPTKFSNLGGYHSILQVHGVVSKN